MKNRKESLTTQPGLIARIRNWDDHEGWSEFYELYQAIILRFAINSGLTESEAQDVRQEVFKHVAKTIKNFECDRSKGSFRGWLMNRTRWCVQDKFRERDKAASGQRRRGAEDERRTDTTLRIPDQTVDVREVDEREQQEYLLELALQRLAKKTKPKHLQMFDLYHRQNWTVTRIARQFDMSPATVYVVTHRLISKLKKELEFLAKWFNK